MKDGFSVELKISNTVLEYDELSGLLSCSIPRQLMPNTSSQTAGIVSQQAEISLSDINLFIYRQVENNKNIGDIRVKIYYNDILVFIGFINESSYDDNGTLNIKVADPLILLSYKYMEPKLSKTFSIEGLIDLIRARVIPLIQTKGITASIKESDNNDFPQLYLDIADNRNALDDISFVPYMNMWDIVDNFAKFCFCNVFWLNGTVYIRSLV